MELCTVGGFSEVGKNMVAIKSGNDAVIIDMGIYLPAITDFEEKGGNRGQLSTDDMIKMGILPDDNVIGSWKEKVRAIVIGHCHLDHSAAVAYLARKYRAPVIGTPYTIEIIKTLLGDERIKIRNNLKVLNPNSRYKVSNNLEIELINTTHSTPQSAMVATHFREGTALYANDFKFDNTPIVGKKPNYERLKQLGKENVNLLIMDSLYSNSYQKMPSEKVARQMLEDVMLGTENSNNAIFVTTFASHIARLKSIIEFGKSIDRKILIFGRSMSKYILAAKKVGIIDLEESAELMAYAGKIRKSLKQIEEKREKYLVICTGGQGEPESILSKLAAQRLKFNFKPSDHVIFSNRVIPAPINIANRERLEANLKASKVRIFKDIHVSGHPGREDLRDLITMVKPRNIIPSHGNMPLVNGALELSQELGFSLNKDLHLMTNGQKLVV